MRDVILIRVENDTADLLKDANLTITSDRSADLLRTGGDSELALGGQTVVEGLLRD